MVQAEPPLGIRVLGLISTLGKSRPVSLMDAGERYYDGTARGV